MVLLQLSRAHTFLFARPPSFHAHSNFSAKPTTLKPILTATLAPKSTLAATEPVPNSHFAQTQAETPQDFETQVEISLDKLFVPPDTEVSVGDDGAALGTRILRGSNIVLSKYARNAQVVEAEFVKSSVSTDDCPSDGLPEFALVGRSNVGKSSLLNSLVRRKRLALTSKKPG